MLRPPGPVHATADAERLTDVLLALAASSAREGAEDRTRLVIGWNVDSITDQIGGATLWPGRYARITLREDGCGLRRSGGQTLFETFLDPRASSSRVFALARAYALAREWRGGIAVSSIVGQGAAFSVYLPYLTLQDSTESETGAESVPVEQAPSPQIESRPETILVVDDDASIRRLLRRILERAHYQVLEAGGAEEALTIAMSRAAPIDLLITDVTMPGLTGPELARRMREASPNLRVLYISGYSEDAIAEAGQFPLGSHFLAKPFTMSELLRAVRETLDAS